MKTLAIKTAAVAVALLLASTPALACGCCGGAAKDAQKSGGCMGGMSGMSDGNQSKKPMCGMGGMSMTQKQSDNSMMDGMDHSKMETEKMETGAIPAAPQSTADQSDEEADFAKSMIPHHQSSMDVAAAYLQTGKNPQMRKLAEEILKAKDREIAFMNGWLAANAK